MKILVPMKRVADPSNANRVKVAADGSKVTTDGLQPTINTFDLYAVETALRLNEDASKPDSSLGSTVVVSLGSDDVQQVMRFELGRGAERGILIKATDEELDGLTVAKALKAVVDEEKPDLVLMGKQAVDGDSNTVGQMLAELLGWPMATFAMSIGVEDGGKALKVGREVDTGVLTVKVQLPAVVTVDLRIVAPTAVKNGVTPDGHQYTSEYRTPAIKGIMAAKKKPIDIKTLGDLGVTATSSVQYSKFELPPARTGNVNYVETVDDLVGKLRTEAKVL